MSEKFVTRVPSVASGADKTLVNLFHIMATPVSRGKIYELVIAGAGAPGDNSADLLVNRTTAVGTEGSGLVPDNLDPVGPVGDFDSGLGVFAAEPTYTAGKILLAIPGLNHRLYFPWRADRGCELVMAATQNNGAGLKTVTSTNTQAYGATIFHME